MHFAWNSEHKRDDSYLQMIHIDLYKLVINLERHQGEQTYTIHRKEIKAITNSDSGVSENIAINITGGKNIPRW